VTQGQSPPPGGYQQPGQQGYQQPPPGGPLAQSQTQLAGPVPRATFGQRFGAFAIDIVIILVVEIIVAVILGVIIAAIASSGSSAAVGIASLLSLILFLLYIAIPIVYFGYMEGQPSGQTFGKRALNIRVVDFDTGGPIPMGRAMLRSLVRSLISGILLLGYLWMLWDPQQQTWHDKIVRTTVVPVGATA
jgi:uncharacterized RDD family membrane protein YckC